MPFMEILSKKEASQNTSLFMQTNLWKIINNMIASKNKSNHGWFTNIKINKNSFKFLVYLLIFVNGA